MAKGKPSITLASSVAVADDEHEPESLADDERGYR